MTHVLRVPDKDLVATAGIDALAFIRVCQFGIQLFVPITFVVIIVLVPIHNAGGDLARQKEEFIRQGGNAEELRSGLDSKLMRSTAANLNEGDPVMWIHVVLMWLITLYATWLLRRHTRTFALLRQLYLSTAGDTNLWRAVHMPGTILQQMLVQGRELEAELDVHKMREQVAKAQINESLDPGDQPGEQLVGNTDLLVGPDGQPIMLTSIEAVEQRAGVAGAVATPNASGGPDPPGGPGSNFKPKGGIPTLSTPTRASTGARASLNFDAVAAASNAGERSDGDGSVHKEKVRRGSQLKPLKPSRDGDGASPTVSVSGGSLHGGSDAKDALGRMETMRANMRRSSVNANTFEALAVLATPVLAEKVHHADPKGAKGSAEKVIRQVAKKFGSLTRANTERSALGAKPPPSDKAPVGLGREGLLPVRTSGDRSRVSTDLAPSTGAAPGRASTERGTLNLMPLRTNAAPGMARRQEEEEAEEARRRRALENQLAAEGGISVDIPDDVDRLPPRAGTANPAYSTPTSAAAAAAAAAAATAGAFDEGPIEAISPIEQVAVSPTTPSSGGGGGGGGRRRSNIPVSLRKSIEEARRKASAEVGDRGGSTEATIAEEKSEETDHPPGPGPVTESFVGRGGDGTTEPPDGERETASSTDPPVTRPALRTYVDEDGRTTVYMGPPGTTPGGGTAGTQTQQQTGGFLERVRAARRESHPPPGPPTSTADALLSPPRMRGRHSRRGSGGGGVVGGAGGVPLRPPVFELTGAAAEGLEGLIEASKEREKGREKKKRHARNKSDIGAAFATLGLGGIGIDEASTLAGARNNNPNLNPSKSAKNVSGGGGGASGDANESGSGASGGGVSVGGSRGGSVGSAAELSLELSHLSSMRSFGSHGGERGGSSGTHSVPLTPLRSMRDALGGGGGAGKNHPKTPASRSHHEKLRSAQKARAMRRGASFHTTDELRRENSSGSLQNMAASGHSVGGAIDHRPLGQGLSLGNIHFHESAAVNDKPRAPSSKIVARKGFLPADIIGLNPEAYTPHVKRVLEDIAEAHRARAHRRTASGGSSEDGDVFNRATAGAMGLDGLSKHSSRNNLSGGNSSRDAAPSGKTSQSDEYFDFLDEHEAGGPDVAIKHRWWAGLNIDSDSDDDDYGDVESRKESKFQAYYVRPEDEDYDHKQLPRHDSLGSENGTQPATDTSVRGPERQRISRRDETNDKKGQARARRLVEMPVPDVNAKRTVNTYDPDGKRLVSVWAANYTVLMTDLVATRMADGTERYPLEAVEAMFNSLFPDEFRGIIPIFDHREVDRLLDERDELLNTYNKLKERQSRSYQTMYAKRVNDVMTAVDAAWYDLQQCERAVVLAREAALQSDPGPSCFVVFATQKAAAQAAQCLLHSGSRRNFRVQPAPGPDNVNWQSVLYRRNQSMRRVFFIMPMIILLILFPSGIFTVGISMACNVEPPSGLRGFLTWYCSEEAVVFQSIVSGLLPPILLTLWEVFVVSFFMMYLVQAQNVHASLSNTDRRFLRYYYVWVFVNVLMGGITGGALTGFVEDLMDSSNTTYSLQQHLGRVLPISSNFFLVFVFFRAVYLPVQRLIVPHPGIICWAVRKYLCIFKCAVTPRDRTIKYSPRGVRMGREVGVFLMTVMLGLTFCLIAPVMAPACVLFFVMNFVVWRYHVLYVYERGYESNGSMWFTVVELTVWALLISQVFTSFVLFSKAAWIPGLALYLTVPYYLYRYYVNLRSEFGSGSAWSVPLGEAAKAPPADFSAEIYTHPSLRPAAMGWHPDVGKVWRGYPGVAGKTTF